jgi:hypothetical protein
VHEIFRVPIAYGYNEITLVRWKMVQITVSDELAQAIAQAMAPVMLVDSRGRELAQIMPLNTSTPTKSRSDSADDEWSEAKLQMETYRREGGSFYTTKEVLEHLNSLGKE